MRKHVFDSSDLARCVRGGSRWDAKNGFSEERKLVHSWAGMKLWPAQNAGCWIVRSVAVYRTGCNGDNPVEFYCQECARDSAIAAAYVLRLQTLGGTRPGLLMECKSAIIAFHFP